MRAMLLGQDRYRRRYLALPHLGGVLVEGPEELLSESENKFKFLDFTNPWPVHHYLLFPHISILQLREMSL